jgi:hypothetical protein
MVDPRADFLWKKAVFETELHNLVGEGADQTDLHLKGNAAAAWWKQQQFW